ncbi:hypothetical protein ACKFKG_32380 [Phormidesmis sp. 146-35]
MAAEKITTEEFLRLAGIDQNSFKIISSDLKKTQTTDEFLKEHGVGKDALTADQARSFELRHRLTARMIILGSLVAPMSIAPFWLMALLSLPAFGLKPYSEAMQAGLLAGLVSDVAGLYYVVTRDLFPKGQSSNTKSSNTKSKEEEDGED